MIKPGGKLASRLILEIKSRPGFKNFLIKIFQRVGLHRYALIAYSKVIGISKTHFTNWLISETISELEFKDRFNQYLGLNQVIEEDLDGLLNEMASKLIISSEPRVAILCSIYRSDKFLESFLIDLLKQDYFFNTEPCFVISDPSSYELDLLEKFTKMFNNSKLHVYKDRVGIYQSWNQALLMSDAPLITNMNVDDSRRSDSIKRQVSLLSRYPFVDVAYQDVHVSLLPHLPWGAISSIAPKSNLPSVSFAGLLAGVNSPHNAPMWRRKLHFDHGVFDEKYKSAGDYDFWLRVSLSGALFMKDNDAHVSYYFNPKGLSTRGGSIGGDEMYEIQRKYVANNIDYSEYDRSLSEMAKFGIESNALTIAAIIRIQEIKEPPQ
jgi:hypothetical protein